MECYTTATGLKCRCYKAAFLSRKFFDRRQLMPPGALSSPRTEAGPAVKICGITNFDDCRLAVAAGADYVGMIMWPGAKRSVSDNVARDICSCARDLGAKPIGVFVDESPEEIFERSSVADLALVQLHGLKARMAMASHAIGSELPIVYVLHATPDGKIVTELPSIQGALRKPEFLLVDSLKGGSGVAIDWQTLSVPLEEAKSGWLLAGGLTPGNVARAVQVSNPHGVDVSSGVCGPDGLRKNVEAMKAFVDNARNAKYLTWQ